MIVYGTDGRLKFDPKLGSYPPVGGGGVAVSAGAASQSTGTVIFSNSNGVSFGLNAGTLTASVAAGAGIAAAAGTQTAGTGTVVFANSNGLTFGMSGSSQITASHNALTTAAQSNQVVNSLNGSTGQISLATGSSLSSSQNGSTITFGLASNITTALQSAGAYLTTAANSTHTHGSGPSITGPISVTSNSSAWSISISNYLTTARASNDAIGLNTAATSVTWTVNSSGISLNAGAYLTTAANSTHSHGNPTLALTNLTGTTASASNGLTISLSAAAPGAGGGFAAQGSGAYTQNTGTIQWANSNRVTFGLSTNQMTASIDAAGTGLTTASTTGSVLIGTNNSAGLSLGVPAWLTVAAGGGGAGTNTGLNLTNLTGTLAVNTSGVSLSLSGPAPGGGGGINRSFFELMDGERITTCALLNNATYSNRPIFNPFWMDGSGLTCNTIRLFLSRTGGTSLNVSIDVGFYTIANATSMNLISSTRHGYSLTTSGQFSGIRGFDITGLGQAGFSLSEGRYVLGFKMSMVSTASGGLNLMGGDAFNNVGWVLPGTNSTAATATNSHLLPFWGVYTATSANLPSGVGASQISGGNSQRNPDIYAIIKEI